MVRQLWPVYLPKLGRLQDTERHRLHNQNSDRCQQQILSPGFLPRFHDGVLVLNLSPGPLYFYWKKKITVFN